MNFLGGGDCWDAWVPACAGMAVAGAGMAVGGAGMAVGGAGMTEVWMRSRRVRAPDSVAGGRSRRPTPHLTSPLKGGRDEFSWGRGLLGCVGSCLRGYDGGGCGDDGSVDAS